EKVTLHKESDGNSSVAKENEETELPAYMKSAESIRSALAELQQDNPDTIGWFAFDNLDISYPLMQGTDNDYYLNHTFSGEKNSAGSIFMEAVNHPDLSDTHTIIYGHNMKNLSMFGSLRSYKTEDFYEGNEYFTIYTLDGVYRYQIFSYYDISEYGDIYKIWYTYDDDFEELIKSMKRRAYYDTGVKIYKYDQIVTLSTCSTEGNRFVVHGKLLEQY
ncbi:class B sortase, partial [Lachnospiraceae bacterium OttesenSCG-928-D06]|nr:class B sortase [Lachnospiraceae bacterium OttesenSCG-928-D06]